MPDPAVRLAGIVAQLEIKPSPQMRLRVLTLFVSAVFLSSVLIFLLAGGTGDLFARRATLTTYMPDAAGIAKGDEVRLDGLRIGKVQNVELANGSDRAREVRAQILILARYLKEIPEDSQTAISADTMVADKFIAIKQGKSPAPVREGGVLRGEPFREASVRANQLDALHNDLTKLDQILAELSSPDTQSGQIFQSSQMYDSTLAGMEAFHQTLHKFTNPQSDLGQAFYSLKLYDAIEEFIRTVEKALSGIQNGEGALGHAFASDEQYNETLRSLKDLHSFLADANAGKGGWGAWLQDDSNYREFVRVLAEADRSIARLNTGEGTAGQLLANAQLYESLNGSLRNMEAMLRDLRQDPHKYLRVHLFRKNPMEVHRRASAKR